MVLRTGHMLVFIFLFVIPSFQASGQLSSGGNPVQPDDLSEIPVIDFSPFFAARKGSYDTLQDDKNTPYRFAIPVTTVVDPSKDGIWKSSGNGTRVWRVKILCKDASSISFIFNRFHLETEEKLYVYDPERISVLGAFTEKNNKSTGSLALVPLKGNCAIIQWEVPSDHSTEGKLSLSQIGLGYRDIYRQYNLKDQFYGTSGACNVDINCPAGENWQVEKNSVVRIYINGDHLCSGVLLNNVNDDATPYILTAGHCIENSADAASAVFVFGYESPYCDGPDGSVYKSISGAELKAWGGSSIDFALVEMSKIPPFIYYPYYAGWNTSNTPPTSTVIIHHPNGDVKKISVDGNIPGISNYDTYDDNSFWWIKQWDIGTTEPGSSGAPLFDQDHRVIGNLSGGDAHCGSSINDYFQMFGYTWDTYSASDMQMKFWLDPEQTGLTLHDGYDPYVTSRSSCDTLTNINPGETLRLYEWDGTNTGYLTGHNTGSIRTFAEFFYNPDLVSITGLYIMPGISTYDSPTDKITIRIWEGGTVPGNIIYRKDVPLNYFLDSVWNFIDLEQIVTVNGNFFAGYEIYYDDPGGPLTDQFAVMQVEARTSNEGNSAYYLDGNTWVAFNEAPPDYMFTSLAIEPVLCGEIPVLGIRSVTSPSPAYAKVKVSPNPVTDKSVILTFPEPLNGLSLLSITDLTGKVVFRKDYSFFGIQGSLLLPYLRDGMYILSVTNAGKDFRAKLIVRGH